MCKTNTSRDIFTYGTPESVGISSASLAAMYEELRDSRFLSHSFLVARHGRIVSEGYFAPFTKDSFQVEGYQYHPFDFEIPLAI